MNVMNTLSSVTDPRHQDEPGGGGGAAPRGAAAVGRRGRLRRRPRQPRQGPQDPTHRHTGQESAPRRTRTSVVHTLVVVLNGFSFSCFALVCQVVPSDGQENGQMNEEDEAETAVKDEQRRTSRESRQDSVCEEAAEPQPAVSADGETTKKGEAPAGMGGQSMCS